MDFLEKDLEDIIWENLQTLDGIDMLLDRGLEVDSSKHFYRQYNFGAFGICDIIGFRLRKSVNYPNCYLAFIDIYELKKDSISASTFLQASRYAKACLNIIDQYNDKVKHTKYVEARFNLFLVGSKVELSNDFVYIPDIFDNVKIVTYKITLEGLTFKEERGYSPKGFKGLLIPSNLKMYKKW